MTVANEAHLDLATGELRVRAYEGEVRTVAEDVDAMEVTTSGPKNVEADAECVTATFEMALNVQVEDRAGRRVAVLGGPKR